MATQTDLAAVLARLAAVEKALVTLQKTVNTNGIPGVVVTDPNGVKRAALAVEPATGAELALFDAKGRQRIAITVSGAGPLVQLLDENGEVCGELAPDK